MTRRIVFVAAAVLALTSLASAADVNGKWTAQVPGRNGTRDTTFELKESGGTVSGTMSVEGQSTPLQDGKLSGDTLSFSATVERGGNQLKFTFTGHVSGDQIHFKREGGQAAREFTAKRAK